MDGYQHLSFWLWTPQAALYNGTIQPNFMLVYPPNKYSVSCSLVFSFFFLCSFSCSFSLSLLQVKGLLAQFNQQRLNSIIDKESCVILRETGAHECAHTFVSVHIRVVSVHMCSSPRQLRRWLPNTTVKNTCLNSDSAALPLWSQTSTGESYQA